MTIRSILPKYLELDLEPYSGRFIALVEGQIVAVGDSADATFVRAKIARHQRPPTILSIAASKEVFEEK
ncbi:MAG: hypothetical protein GY759_05855 [Chloroflexi bacterium]|nr:hypothetical protein [Chloroflexota bacterium]